ncbi:MAG: NAD(P)-dependent oxidoreductase [Candidatus Atribacteria bacterium]|nr:NAD(P)-dependent oxidoreductase [Candidatus Atribacteria bacterium]
MDRILVTGGSGFIGTNLIDYFLSEGNHLVLNLDIEEPKLKQYKKFWKEVDIRDAELLHRVIMDFNPSIVIHLAARTDLNGKRLEDYNSNTLGIKNLLEVLDSLQSLKRVIFTSSMYVCAPGYEPQSEEDYAPHTIYGESKVLSEKIIKNFNPQKYTWCIIRPTSIWGPWFGEPYANFFKIVMGRNYFHMGKKACSKTYGYIGNTLYQLKRLLEVPSESIDKKLFYIGDWPAYNISEWADEIAQSLGFRVKKIPFFVFRIAGLFGDLLKVFGIQFPMTSFRLRNMTTNNVHNLEAIKKIAPEIKYSRIEGIELTVKWILSQKSK